MGAGSDAFAAADAARVVGAFKRIDAKLAGRPARAAIHAAFFDHPIAVQ